MKKVLSILLTLAMLISVVVPFGTTVAASTQLGSMQITKVGGLWTDYTNAMTLIPEGSTVTGLWFHKLYAVYDSSKGGYVVEEKVASHRSYERTVASGAVGLCFNYTPLTSAGSSEAIYNWKTWCKIRVGDVLTFSSFSAGATVNVTTDRSLTSDTAYNNKTVVAIGDSLTANGGWTEDVSDIIGTDIINSGMGGDTTSGVLSRFDRDVTAYDPDIVLIMIGANDLMSSGFSQSKVNSYRTNLGTLYDKCVAIGAQPIFMTHNKIKTSAFDSESRYAAFGGIVGATEAMANTVKSVAAEKGALVIDNWSYWKNLDETQYLIDTCHPNGAGYDMYVSVISEFMLDNVASILGGSFIANLDAPSGQEGGASTPVKATASVNLEEQDDLYVQGWALHSAGISSFTYSFDDGEYLPLTGQFRADVDGVAVANGYTNCGDLNAFAMNVPLTGLTSGTHTLSIRGNCKDNTYFTVGVITLDVTAPTYFCEPDVPDGAGAWNTNSTAEDSVVITDAAQTYAVSGWSVHSSDVTSFFYSIDDGAKTALNSGYRDDVGAAVPDYAFCQVNSYTGNIAIADLAAGTHTITISGLTGTGNYYTVVNITLNVLSNTQDYPGITVESGNAVIDNDEGVITGIVHNTTASELLATLSDGVITDKDGNELTTEKLASGYKLLGYNSAGYLCYEYTIIVTGDVVGDGIVNSKDVIAAKLLKSGKNAGYSRAVDTDGDGVITSSELTAVSRTVAEQ